MHKSWNEFKKIAQENGIKRWPINEVNAQGEPHAYEFSEDFERVTHTADNQDNNDPETHTPRSWEDLALHFNSQSDPAIIKNYNDFWGFPAEPRND